MHHPDQTKEIIRQVKKVEITTKNLVDGIIAGNYHSVFKGQGIEFSDIRGYNPGDDIRTIDWKVTARLNQPFVKEFIEERDLLVYFLFDASASGSFGNQISKRNKAIEMTASLIFAAMRNNDNMGLIMFTDKIERFVPPRKGRKHALKLIREMITFEPESKKTDIKNCLVYASKLIKKRSVIFIISDFYSPDFMQPLRIIKKNNDIVPVRIHDKREFEMPDIGLIELEDEETGEQILVDTSDPMFRQRYLMEVRASKAQLEKSFNKMGIDCLDIVTDNPYETPLRKFFKMRKHRVVR